MTGHDRDDLATARRAVGLIDLTDLTDECTADGVAVLCERARRHGTAAVCVWPDFVAVASEALAGSPVRVATVVNFPTGEERPFAVGVLTDRVLADGAHEVDVVLPYRAWLDGDRQRPGAVLDAVRSAVSSADARMKVILETGALVDLDQVRDAARFAVDHGTDFVKTSTGKIPVSATLDAVRVMLDVIASAGGPVGLKPSGGISSLGEAAAYLGLADKAMGPGWVTPDTFRFGASGLLSALLAVLGDETDGGAGGPEPVY